MARILNSNFGLISGKVGDFVYKVKNGKQFISAAPSRRVVDNSLSAVSRRKKFSACSKISSALSKDVLLKSVWNNDSPLEKSSAFTKISKFLYPLINSEYLFRFVNHITPFPGFVPCVEFIRFSDDFSQIDLKLRGVMTSDNAKYLCGSVFVFLTDALHNFIHNDKFYSPVHCRTELNHDGRAVASFSLDNIIIENISLYKSRLFLFQFYLCDENNSVTGYSNVIKKYV